MRLAGDTASQLSSNEITTVKHEADDLNEKRVSAILKN